MDYGRFFGNGHVYGAGNGPSSGRRRTVSVVRNGNSYVGTVKTRQVTPGPVRLVRYWRLKYPDNSRRFNSESPWARLNKMISVNKGNVDAADIASLNLPINPIEKSRRKSLMQDAASAARVRSSPAKGRVARGDVSMGSNQQ